MNILIFDTETISLNKPFCYNVGYCIYNTELGLIIDSKEFVIEQVWHNPMLFATAYYTEKRPYYVSGMRGKRIKLEKFGKVCQQMKKDIEQYEISYAYAFNSPFDDRVFTFNCDWFKCINPFDNVEILDIRGIAQKYIGFTWEYKAFCELYELFTEKGNYSTTAESFGKFLFGSDLIEEHTALSDAILETAILIQCLELGGEIGKNYKAYKSVPRKIEED